MITKSTKKQTTKVTALAAASMCVIALAFALVGCGGMSPTQTADAFLKAVQSGEKASAEGIYDGDASMSGMVSGAEGAQSEASSADASLSTETSDAFAEKLAGFQYKLGNEKIDGDTATVEVSITTYNMSNVMSEFMTKYFQQALPLAFTGASEEQLSALGEQILLNEIENAPMNYEKTVPLAMTKKDGKWVVDNLNDQKEFANALTGGLLSAADSMQRAFGSN